MTNIPTYAISFNLYYGGQSVSEMLESGEQEIFAQAEPVTEKTPQFKNIFIKGVTVKGAKQAVFLQGLPEMNVENVSFTDVLIEADNGFSVIDATGIILKNVELITRNKTAFEFFNCKNVKFTNVRYNSNAESGITVNGGNCSNISLNSSAEKEQKKHTVIGEEVPPGAVIF
jgi:hypothetical protein